MQRNTEKPINKDIIWLIRLAVGQAADADWDAVDGKAIDWNSVCKTACRHRVENLVYEALRLLPEKLQPDAEIRTALKQNAGVSTVQDMHQYYEVHALFEAIEKRKIPVIPLKGWVLKEIYPKSDLRSMADVDLLIHEEDAQAVKKMVQELGYEIFLYGSGKHDVYRKKPYMSYEFHKRLTGNKEACDVGSIWSRARKTDGYEYRYQMSEEDFYIHLIIHMAGHMVNGGTGIRSFLDLWVYSDKYGGMWDEEYINARLKELGLEIFAKQAQHLAELWFGDGEEEETEEDVRLEEFVLNSAAYGTTNVTVIGNVVVGDKISSFRGFGKIKYVCSRLFPSYKWMAGRYDALERYPYALPGYYIYRLYKNGLKRIGAVRREINNVKRLDENHISELQELYHVWGLDAGMWGEWH